MPISLIRQHLSAGHWYDRAKLTPKHVAGCQYVAAMNPSAGSFAVNPRLQRLFLTLAVDFPGQESLMKIYGTFLSVREGGGVCVLCVPCVLCVCRACWVRLTQRRTHTPKTRTLKKNTRTQKQNNRAT